MQKDEGNTLKDEWIVASWICVYMIDNLKMFYEYRLLFCKDQVPIADGSYNSLDGNESISLLDKYYIKDVLHASEVFFNLLQKKLIVN